MKYVERDRCTRAIKHARAPSATATSSALLITALTRPLSRNSTHHLASPTRTAHDTQRRTVVRRHPIIPWAAARKHPRSIRNLSLLSLLGIEDGDGSGVGPTPVSPAKRKEPPSSDSDDKETPESQKSEGRKDRERAARYSYASPQAHAEGGTVRSTGDRKIVPGAQSMSGHLMRRRVRLGVVLVPHRFSMRCHQHRNLNPQRKRPQIRRKRSSQQSRVHETRCRVWTVVVCLCPGQSVSVGVPGV